ncbi:MAG: surfeit locus 1 family protein [Rhodobacteraceae bacterium HLUCCA08]|nr:MAG: surfeit locus 1 family protein [Rhodobacteraceae bacterium HLUCCA08]
MLRKLAFPILLGVAGVAILVALAIWQMQRLAWKEGVIARIEAQIAADPVLLPAAPDPVADNYLPVIVEGAPTGQELHVLTSGTPAGQGYRVISAFETAEGRRILLDQGLMDYADKDTPPATDPVTVQGNLVWPDEGSAADKAPNLAENIWFARAVAPMAGALDTEPLLLVQSAASAYDPRITPLPVDTRNIRNDHLEYMITWFSLAAVWAAMSGWLATRILRRKD